MFGRQALHVSCGASVLAFKSFKKRLRGVWLCVCVFRVFSGLELITIAGLEFKLV